MSMKFDIFFGIIHVTKKKLFDMKFNDIGGQGSQYNQKSSFRQYLVCASYMPYFFETKKQK